MASRFRSKNHGAAITPGSPNWRSKSIIAVPPRCSSTPAAETVVDDALRFKQHYGRDTWVCGDADDMLAAIPSRRVWEEGGYNGGEFLYEHGRPAFRWAGDIEDRNATTSAELVAEVSSS